MFVRQIVDPAEDGQVPVDFIFGRDVHKTVVFNVEIRATKIQFFSRVSVGVAHSQRAIKVAIFLFRPSATFQTAVRRRGSSL